MDDIHKKYFNNKASEILIALGIFRDDSLYPAASKMISDNLQLAFLEGQKETAKETIRQIKDSGALN